MYQIVQSTYFIRISWIKYLISSFVITLNTDDWQIRACRLMSNVFLFMKSISYSEKNIHFHDEE